MCNNTRTKFKQSIELGAATAVSKTKVAFEKKNVDWLHFSSLVLKDTYSDLKRLIYVSIL
jgi:hypothetical protein